MTGQYAAITADALAIVKEYGAPVTFTLTTPGTHDEDSDTWSEPTSSTVTGHAVRDDGDPDRYRALELIESSAPTLLFTPNVRGQLPALKSSVVWGGLSHTVRDVDPIAPDGVAIAAKVVVVR